MSDPQIRYVRTSDGVNIAHFTMGEGVPLVMINLPVSNLQHELATPRIRATLDETARDARLVRFDHRGFGLSDKFEGAFTTPALVLDLEAVVDKLELARFILVAGYGPTYPIALAYAALHPERVLAIVATIGGPTADFTAAMVDMPDADWQFISETLARRISTQDPEGASAVAEDVRVSVDLEGLKRLNTWSQAASKDESPEDTGVPCLFMPTSSGGRDWIDTARALAARMPNAAVQPISGATVDERTQKTRRAIRTFLAEVLGGANPRRPRALARTSGTAVILFTDIVSSTELTERMGDVAFRDASRSLDAGLRGAIRDAGGAAIEGKLLGDGVLATFPSAAQAIDGARRCLALSAASELGLHIGLHAGDVIREDNNVYGGAVNIAARICGLSAPGEILVSDVVRGMARSSAGVEFEDRGEQEMKGVGDPVRVYAVRGGDR